MARTKKVYKRVLLKLSGEALAGERGYGLDVGVIQKTAQEIKEVTRLGTQLGVVVGGGNIFRGLAASARGMDRIQADYLGMLATLFNAVAIRETLVRVKVPAMVFSALPLPALAETYYPQTARREMEAGKVLLLAAGTGNPYFTTDTAAALRASELGADLILKATQVDGVYDDDPRLNPQARLFAEMEYDQYLQGRLEVMDATAISLARENNIPIVVFNGMIKGHLKKIITGSSIGTLIRGGRA
ncbi:MAG: UMP kinase [Desulfobacterota bacterium]|jgi:uridylate kinase|nr:UMP kinase [Thermodesulfobacteriota bacterium]